MNERREAAEQALATEEKQFLEQYQRELDNAYRQGQAQGIGSPAMFGGQQKMNLVEWQLDFKPELEDIERLLRCDVLVRDAKGNEIWQRNPDKEYVLFNDVGVNDIIREIRMFLNKNKVLSNYAFEEIKPRVLMLGHEIRALIYNNYERYGIDNEYKMNNYPMIVLTILDMIESAFRRAINGEERRDLNSARIVQQNDPVQPNNINVYASPQGNNKKSKWYNPLSWRG